MSSVQIILFFLPILINCEIKNLVKQCSRIVCPDYKSNTSTCKHGADIADPFTNKCVPKCDGPCINESCNYCFCYSTDENVIESTYSSECKRIVWSETCTQTVCSMKRINNCNSNYTLNRYNHFECLLRCDEDSCGEGGTCSQTGYCVCHLGYRPDIMNPRICLKIPENNTTKLEKTCHKGFKFSDDGECVSACGDCKNGCCSTDGVCQCWDGYELDVETSTCLPKKSCSGRCLNGVCDSDGVCQCQDCSDFIDKGVNCRADNVGGLDADYNCGNTSYLGDDMISGTKHKTSIAILLCFTVILLIVTIILMFIALKMKRALPINEGKVKILFGELG